MDWRIVSAEHAQAWQDLRITGARCEILDYGGIRGVFDRDGIVGFCGYRPQHLSRTRHRGEIGRVFVTRAFQGSAAGSTLMRGVITFYEKHGFMRAGLYKNAVRINGKSRDDFFYVLRLDA